MNRLGYTRYVAQGGDVGAAVTDAMGRHAPEGLLGIHVNLLAGALGLKDQLPAESEQERAAHKALETAPRRPGGTGNSHALWPQPVRPARFLQRSRFRSASRRSPARSGLRRAAG